MPGPRKNLTPLDMKMMGLAFNQGGIINFLGQQPEVTAPVRAQSHADSPPVQLTYITDAEKDLLVNANIHGSMNGKPNPGPAGLESLDDFFTKPGGGMVLLPDQVTKATFPMVVNLHPMMMMMMMMIIKVIQHQRHRRNHRQKLMKKKKQRKQKNQ